MWGGVYIAAALLMRLTEKSKASFCGILQTKDPDCKPSIIKLIPFNKTVKSYRRLATRPD